MRLYMFAWCAAGAVLLDCVMSCFNPFDLLYVLTECKLKQSGARSYRNTVAMSEQQQQPQPQQASSAAANATLNTAELSQRARELDTAVEQLQENGIQSCIRCSARRLLRLWLLLLLAHCDSITIASSGLRRIAPRWTHVA